MTEIQLQIVTSLKIVWLAIYTLLYGFGGIFSKPLRRIYGSILLVTGFVGFSLWLKTFSYFYLLCLPLLFGATSIGYGDNSALQFFWLNKFGVLNYNMRKLLTRVACGLAYAVATLPVFIIQKQMPLFGLQVAICCGVSGIFGVWNPYRSARAEESTIAASIGFLPLMIL